MEVERPLVETESCTCAASDVAERTPCSPAVKAICENSGAEQTMTTAARMPAPVTSSSRQVWRTRHRARVIKEGRSLQLLRRGSVCVTCVIGGNPLCIRCGLIFVEPQSLAERWPGNHARHHHQSGGAHSNQDDERNNERAVHHDLNRQHMLNDVELGASDSGAGPGW